MSIQISALTTSSRVGPFPAWSRVSVQKPRVKEDNSPDLRHGHRGFIHELVGDRGERAVENGECRVYREWKHIHCAQVGRIGGRGHVEGVLGDKAVV